MNIICPETEELAVVGIAIFAKGIDTSVLAKLTEQDFYNVQARTVFRSIKSLLSQQQRLDIQSIDECLTRRLGNDQTQALLHPIREQAAEYMLGGWQLQRLVDTVIEGSKRRTMQRIGERLAQSATDETQELSSTLANATDALKNCVHSKAQITSGFNACMEAYDAAFAKVNPVSTGISELDAILCGGLHKGELTICGARPSIGKSSVLLSVALNAASQGKRVLFVSLEMSLQQIGARILAAKSGVNAGIFRSGGLTPDPGQNEKDDKIAAALTVGVNLAGKEGIDNILLLYDPGLSIETLEQDTKSVADSGGLDLVVVDYLQLMRSDQRNISDFERLGIVSRGLKRLSLSLDVPVLAAAQVRRQNNNGVLRAPGLDELRGSGDIEQDADNVWLLHRIETPADSTLQSAGYKKRHEGLYNGVQMHNKQLLTIEVGKQRQGVTARAWFIFDPPHMTFSDPFIPDRKEVTS